MANNLKTMEDPWIDPLVEFNTVSFNDLRFSLLMVFETLTL